MSTNSTKVQHLYLAYNNKTNATDHYDKNLFENMKMFNFFNL